MKLIKIKCNKCQHEWSPRVEDVRVCPKCHSLRWDKDINIENQRVGVS